MVVKESPFTQSINVEHEVLMLSLMEPMLIKDNTVDIKILYKDKLQKIKPTKQNLSRIFKLESLCQKLSFSENDVLITITAQTYTGRDLTIKMLLNGQACSADYKPTPPPTPPKIIKKSFLKSHHTLFLIVILLVLTSVLAILVLLGFRYWRKKDKPQDEL